MLHYEFGKHIGQGGMADVFLGFQRGMGGFEKLVVLKQILPCYADNEIFVSMFVNEAKTAASIQHPNVVQTYDIRQDKDRLFIAMEYIDGLTLVEIMRAMGDQNIPVEIAARIVTDIVAGLHAAHTQTNAEGALVPIVHLDLTPSNLMVSTNGVAKILDYGIAMAANTADKSPAFVGGKPGYIPPEYSQSGIVDPRGDIFQVGLVLHELLTGERLFNADSPTGRVKNTLERRIKRPSEYRSDIPKELDDIIYHCLNRELEGRMPSAEVLKHKLLVFLKNHKNPGPDDVGHWINKSCSAYLDKKKDLEKRHRRDSAKHSTQAHGKTYTRSKKSTGPINPTVDIRKRADLTIVEDNQHTTFTPLPIKRRPVGLLMAGLVAATLVLFVSVKISKDKTNTINPQRVSPTATFVREADAEAKKEKMIVSNTQSETLETADKLPIPFVATNNKKSLKRPSKLTKKKKPSPPAHKNKTSSTSSSTDSAPTMEVKKHRPATDLNDPWAL